MENMPDIVITDISMPVMNGLKLTSALKNTSPNIKILFISSHADFEYAREALKLKVSGYILKPFEKNQLIIAIETILNELRGENSDFENQELLQTDTDMQLSNDSLISNEKYIVDMKKYISNHYNKQINTPDVATAVFLSPRYANQLFKTACGCTIFDYITQCRIDEAKRLLIETDEKIITIAEMVGYNGKTSFYLSFKRNLGISPAEYRQNYKN